jgi:aldose 1-epimerase
VATGNILTVDGTAHDFRNFKKIGDGLAHVAEFDQSFIIDDGNTGPVAEVRSERSGLLLQLFSTEPVVHFYSGKWIPPVKGKQGIVYKPFSGFCLETHSYPNAVNFPSFPSDILEPGKTYEQRTRYTVSSF